MSCPYSWTAWTARSQERLPTTMCISIECPVCECLKNELDQTDKLTPLCNGETIKAQVKRAQSEVLEPNGCIKHNCIGLVSFSSSMNAMQCIQYFIYELIYELHNNY